MVTSKDDASILGGESDDVPSLAFINDDGDKMIEHGIFPSVMEESDDVPSSASSMATTTRWLSMGFSLRPR